MQPNDPWRPSVSLLPPPAPIPYRMEESDGIDLELREQAVEETDPIERRATECEEAAVQHMQGLSMILPLAGLGFSMLFKALSEESVQPNGVSGILYIIPAASAILFVASHFFVDQRTVSRIGCVLASFA